MYYESEKLCYKLSDNRKIYDEKFSQTVFTVSCECVPNCDNYGWMN